MYIAVYEVLVLFHVIVTTKISWSFRDSSAFNSKCQSFVYLVVDVGLRVNQRKAKLPPQLLGEGRKN